jgi:hypothetical protein
MTSTLWLASGVAIGLIVRSLRLIRPAPRRRQLPPLRMAWYQRGPQPFPPIPAPLRRDPIPTDPQKES